MSDTLGNIRERLVALPHGAACDLTTLNDYINQRYARILRYRDWERLKQLDEPLALTAPYETGTITVVEGATTITGISTVWTSAMTGRRFRPTSRSESYTFTYVSATSATIDRAFEGENITAGGYSIYKSIYALASLVADLESIRDTEQGVDLDQMGREKLDEIDPSRIQVGEPLAWAFAEDTAAGLVQVELWPIPETAKSLFYRFRNYLARLSATADTLPDWISTECLQAGVEADLYALVGNIQMKQMKEADFMLMLSEMAAEDCRRRQPEQMRMEDRFTRHRFDRATRYGMNRNRRLNQM